MSIPSITKPQVLSLILAMVHSLVSFVCIPVCLILTLHIYACNMLGGTEDGTQCQGWQAATNTIYIFDQQWLITRVLGLDGFTLCNLRGGTYLNLENGSNVNSTKVQGWSRATGGSINNQQWRIIPDSKGGYW